MAAACPGPDGPDSLTHPSAAAAPPLSEKHASPYVSIQQHLPRHAPRRLVRLLLLYHASNAAHTVDATTVGVEIALA